jgi:dimethylglycine dehydrogenase
MAGFLQGGGVGKTLAEWMIHGEPEADAWPMDIARYGDFTANREYIKQTTGQFYSRRFVMTYPNEQLPAGRPLKRSGAYTAMTAAGAVWGELWGLEVPLCFGPPGFQETPTLKRSNAFELVAQECKAVREQVGLLDVSAFSRYEVSGKDAEAWLDRVLSCPLPKPGRSRLAPMLSVEGRLKGDLTVINWGDGTWWLMGSYYLRNWHLRRFHDYIEAEGFSDVQVSDIADNTVGFSLSGPNSRKVLEQLTHQDISHQALPFLGCTSLDVGLIRARVCRISVTGELGYEINCHASEHISLREMLLEAGQEHGIREYGFYGMNSLRMEKSFGIWSAEFMQNYTPGMTGMDRWIDFDKEFIGRDAALKEKQENSAPQRLVTLEIDAEDADASGYEPVWSGDRRIGFITSGVYGHTIDKSLAMALVEPGFTKVGTELTCHVVGVERAARVIAHSPYDPDGSAMRK